MKREIFNKILGVVAPWVVGIAIFWAVSATLFAPQFEGKSLGQGDIAQYSGMSADIRNHREATGEDPQWTGGMFSGMPAYLIDVEYPTQSVKQGASGIAKLFGDPMNMTRDTSPRCGLWSMHHLWWVLCGTPCARICGWARRSLRCSARWSSVQTIRRLPTTSYLLASRCGLVSWYAQFSLSASKNTCSLLLCWP